MSRAVTRVPVVGPYRRYLIPVVNYEGTYALTEAQLREWAVLDTYDMLAPAHEHPQRRTAVAAAEEAGRRARSAR